MPESTSDRAHNAVMQLRVRNHSIVMVNTGPTALAWLIAGYTSNGSEVFCLATDNGYVIDCGPAEDVSFGVGVRPDRNTVRYIAERICRWLSNLDRTVAFGMVMGDIVLGDGKVIEGWRAVSSINYRGHLILTVTPAFV